MKLSIKAHKPETLPKQRDLPTFTVFQDAERPENIYLKVFQGCIGLHGGDKGLFNPDSDSGEDTCRILTLLEVEVD